ncbi:WG repeat-containing protein [uncultured Psychroserpens sp.]|uniref:WG repeat-containing protein n=1 Tax=uncultured Psychroserpens sp. TaxID=255436 RepID=UPI0026240CCC|nr:WG repeat-containing protein [uncultured Psychroserpens sp.]
MRTLRFLFLSLVMIPFLSFSQSMENLDYISPFQNGMAAVKKDNQWAFINTKGDVVINFRADIAISELEGKNYPVFADDRCLIVEQKNGISYFGFIDKTGNTVVEPKFLNATNFYNGQAIALELLKEVVGENKALNKTVSYDKYLEAVIDTNGNVLGYLSPKRTNVILDKKFLRCPPKISAKHISDNLFAFLNDDNTWSIISIE